MKVRIHHRVEEDFSTLISENEEIRKKVYSKLLLIQEMGLDLLKSNLLEKIDRNLFAIRIQTQQYFLRLYASLENHELIIFYILKKKSNRIDRHHLKSIKDRLKQMQGERYDA